MSGSAARHQATTAAIGFKPVPPALNFTENSVRELFGANVFGASVMKERLPRQVYRSLRQTIEAG